MSFVIISPSTSSNSLGRALALADIYRELGDVRVIAHEDGPLWVGAAAFESPVEPFRGKRVLRDWLAAAGPLRGVVTVKPYSPSLDWGAAAVRSVRPEAQLIVDADDHDEDVQLQTLRALPPVHRAASTAKRMEAPFRIRRRLRRWVPQADLVTVSSHALASTLPTTAAPVVRIPHPRASRPYEPPTESPRLRFGFLGTPRRHKGVDEIARVIALARDAELHVLAGAAATFIAAGVPAVRIVEHPHLGVESIPSALRHVDVALLPQDSTTPAGRFQLPAKYLDAIAGGRPVLTSRTPVLEEYWVPGVTLLDDWGSETIRAALATISSPGDRASQGADAARVFERDFSTAATRARLAEVLVDDRPE